MRNNINGQSASLCRQFDDKDLTRMLAIERECFDYPWSQDDFLAVVAAEDTELIVVLYPQVVVATRRLVAYMAVDLSGAGLQILNLAVDPIYRRLGIGRKLVQCPLTFAAGSGRDYVEARVRAKNIEAQEFFREMGFKVDRIERDGYDEIAEEAFVFRHIAYRTT